MSSMCSLAAVSVSVLTNDKNALVLRHLAAAEGCYSVVEWLLMEAHVSPNPVDRFSRTPLEVRGVLTRSHA